MTKESFTFYTDATLKSAFVDMAEEQSLSPADILRRLMREALVDHRDAAVLDRWQRKEIVSALVEADDPAMQPVPNETLDGEWRRRRAEVEGDHA